MPPENDESIRINVEQPLVRGKKMSIDVVFVRNERPYFPGETRIARLTGASDLAREAKTTCLVRDTSDDPAVACVEARTPVEQLETGWLFLPTNDAERLIVDFTQFPGEVENAADLVSEGGDRFDRYHSDQFSELVVEFGLERTTATEQRPIVSSSDLLVDYGSKSINFGEMRTVNEIGLSRQQETVFKYFFGALGFLLGSGVLWKIFGKTEE